MKSLLYKTLIFISLVTAISFISSIVWGTNASAVFNRTQAENSINWWCSQGQTIAHASYGSNPRLNMSTGQVTYDFNVLWKRCNNNFSSEYAITGYDGDVCPSVGRYHQDNWTETRDCIKYTDRHGEGRSHGECGSYRCVYAGFNANVRQGGAGGPPNNGTIYSRFIASRTTHVANWSTVGRASGSSDIQIANVCGAHYYNSSRWGNTYCAPSYVRVSWTREFTITGSSTIQRVANSGVAANKDLAVSGTVIAQPGNRVYWYHDMTNIGPYRSTGILFNVDKNGFPAVTGWNANKDPRNTGPPGQPIAADADTKFVYEYAHFPEEPSRDASPYTVYDIGQRDVGNTVCQNIAWQPRSSSDDNWWRATEACASVPYNYTLTPTINKVTDSQTIDPDKIENDVEGIITNPGGSGSPTKSHGDLRWQITQVVYAPGVAPPQKAGGGSGSGINPCEYLTGEKPGSCRSLESETRTDAINPGDSASYDAQGTSGAYEVGEQICYMMSVRRASSANENWAHSDLKCLIVAKTPKVQVYGGDIFAGRVQAGVATPAGARVSSANSVTPDGIFGSWGEYAIGATGRVINMASASGNAQGVDSSVTLCGLSLLTFTNRVVNGAGVATCNQSAIGNYRFKNTMPNIASRFPVTSSTPVLANPGGTGSINLFDIVTSGAGNRGSRTYTATSNLNIEGGAAIPAGRWLVINAQNQDVTITGNITYTGDLLNSINQIPQVVIIARNITINEGVSNVDAWLVAPGTVSGAGSLTNGVIRTCNRTYNDVNARNCDGLLTVNGPVIARKLLMLRTHGAGAGRASAVPAEIFNLRPDSYLWAYGQTAGTGRVTTVQIKELPPRF
jgi:hypothetical protein